MKLNYFVNIKEQGISLLSDPMQLQGLSFMVDITIYLSELNLNFQGKN